MKKVDLNFKIINPNGEPLRDNITAGELVSQILLNTVLKDDVKIIKYFDWATKLSLTGIIELDTGDCLELKNFIINSDVLFVIAKAQILPKLS